MTRKSYVKPLIVAALWLLPSSLKASDSGACYAAPLPQGAYRVSSPFGMRVHPLAHVWRMHWGVDLACPRGTPVSAVRDGVVLFAGRSQSCYGNVIFLEHANGIVTVYAHLSRIKVSLRRGVFVKEAEVIGAVGATGCTDGGNHLHFEVWQQQRRINPVLICALLRVTRKGVTL
jgi:murein DD-endopeptidase MepM/ murein hydrolase activator NlpD